MATGDVAVDVTADVTKELTRFQRYTSGLFDKALNAGTKVVIVIILFFIGISIILGAIIPAGFRDDSHCTHRDRQPAQPQL